MMYKILGIGLSLLASVMIHTPASAGDADMCAAAQAHARAGQDTYGDIFDRAEEFLNDEEIPHIIYGRKQRYEETTAYGSRFSEKTCGDIYGGCGADKFSIDVSFYEKNEPSVMLKVKSGAQDTKFGYVILGKLRGVMGHEACSDGEFIGGHTWLAQPSNGQINGNIGRKAYVKTSLSQVGRTIAQGYRSQLPSYEDKTLVIRIEDFKSGTRYTQFLDMIEPLGVSGPITYAD
jgi:hypothetical protein